jgi:DNA-binding NtrC family response regulator
VKTILIIDTDVGFVFWLGRTLDDGGYQTIPAKDVPSAIAMIDQFKLEVDLLIVNANLQGSTAFIEQLRRSNVKVIALIADEDSPLPMQVDASRKRPSNIDEKTRLDWIDFIESVVDCEVAQ